jgi:hypothetical protein
VNRTTIGIAAALLCLTPTLASAVAPTTSLAELRARVDAVAAELEAERAAARDELAALRAERAELERQVRAETARGATLDALHEEASNRAQQLDAQASRWHAPTTAAIAVARAHVERGLPFAKAERLAVLDRIERDLAAATPDHARAVERLLRFIEEEEAMGREIALTQQRLDFAGETQLVDVIRISMALMYIRAQDGTFGWAHPTPDGFAVDTIDDPALVDVVRRRFAAHEDNQGLGPARMVLPSR